MHPCAENLGRRRSPEGSLDRLALAATASRACTQHLGLQHTGFSGGSHHCEPASLRGFECGAAGDYARLSPVHNCDNASVDHPAEPVSTSMNCTAAESVSRAAAADCNDACVCVCEPCCMPVCPCFASSLNVCALASAPLASSLMCTIVHACSRISMCNCVCSGPCACSGVSWLSSVRCFRGRCDRHDVLGGLCCSVIVCSSCTPSRLALTDFDVCVCLCIKVHLARSWIAPPHRFDVRLWLRAS